MKSAPGLLLVSAIALSSFPCRAQLPSAGAAASASAAQPTKVAAAPASRAATVIVVPEGTRIPLVLENAISSRNARPGDPVYFETIYPVLVDGHVVIPAGSYMSGELLSTKRPGKIKGRGEIVLKLSQLILPNSYMVNLEAAPGDAATGGDEQMGKEGEVKGPTGRSNDAAIIVRSSVDGAIIGAAAAGRTGAKAGLGAGAAAGIVGVLLTRGPEAELPRGTTMDVVLEKPIPLDGSQIQFKDPGHAPDLAGPPNREPGRLTVPF